MKNSKIEAIVLTVFGVVTLLTSIVTGAGLELVVIGALGTVAGITYLFI